MKLVKSILNFFYNMLPDFNKAQVEKETMTNLANTRDMITRALIVDAAVGSSTPFYGVVYNALKRAVKTSVGASPYDYMRSIANRIDKEGDDTMRYLDTMFNETIIREAMDYSKLNLLQYVTSMRFFNRYTLCFIDLMVNLERGKQLTPAQRQAFKWMEANLNQYALVCAALSMPLSDIKKAIDSLKGIKVDPDLQEAALGVKPGATDVMKMGFMPVNWNMAFLVGLMLNRWDDATNQENKLKVENITIGLMALKAERATASKEQIAGIDKQIAYNENRLTILRAEIEDYEREAMGQ